MYFSNVPTLMPIQTLSRFGQPSTFFFIDVDGVIYCLLGSNLLEENR